MYDIHNAVSTDKTSALGGAVLERLFELGVRLAEGMDRGLADEGLTRSRAEVIWRLRRGGPVTQRALSVQLHVTPRNVTGLVDALEAGGFVARGAHPTDRRATLVALTEKGESAARNMEDGYRRLAESLFGGLRERDLISFVRTLDLVLARLRESGVPPSDGRGR